MSISVKDFCDKHGAYIEVREWALACGSATMHELWARDDVKPEWRIWIATRTGVLSDRDLRFFACWCARQVWHLLSDERSRNAVEVSERFADGKATADELAVARGAAWAAWAASRARRHDAEGAARAAAWAAFAARAAWEDEGSAGDAAGSAAWASSRARRHDAEGAARAAQAKWLRENTIPAL